MKSITYCGDFMDVAGEILLSVEHVDFHFVSNVIILLTTLTSSCTKLLSYTERTTAAVIPSDPIHAMKAI